MAHHKSTKKSIRKNAVRTDVNRARTSRIRTYVKKVEEAILQGDKEVAGNALREAQSELFRGVTKGVLNFKVASRKVSRLSSRIKKIA
ncbi:30S ribosomal protein S20 [Candidatus Arcanobacter lacustris]|jgi:small subunit ribosomal protein S20|uniref:Small ribosomal subunit protein bS20 n=1 Tax=Candidatus Arcanibacter lacustris TaxID=1607817 RepID=A0A0F5MMS7_9RICK|nr:30S ribosomal protein S20 [Candidatus Arcanobacter lacustris]